MMLRFKPFHAPLVFGLVFSLMLGSLGLLGQPQAAYAQDDLSQLLSTADGSLSVRLPAGWVGFDDSGNTALALFSSILFFGEDQAAAEARQAYNLGQATAVPGAGGVVTVVDRAAFEQNLGPLTPDSAVAAVVAGAESQGSVTTVGATAYQTSAGNPAVYAIINDPKADLLSFVVGVEFGDVVALASAEKATADFEATKDLLAAILDTMSAPAETSIPTTTGLGGGGLGSTGVVSGEASDLAFVVTDDSVLSISLPAEWVFEDRRATDGLFLFGENATEVENRAVFWLSNELVEVSGSGGFVAVVEWETIGLDASTIDLQVALTNFLGELGHSDAEEFQEVTIGGQTPAIYTVLTYPSQKTFVAIIAFNEKLAIVTTSAPLATFDENRNLLLEVMQSVSIPAGEAPVNPTGSTGLAGNPASAGQTVSASNGSLSVVLPEGWVAQDNVATDNFLAFGENADAASNRATFWQADASVQAVGIGGIITLNAYADLGYTADTMEPIGTLDTFIESIGLITVQPSQTFNIAGVVASYAVVDWNNTRGVLMLIPFQESLALIYASTTPENLEANLDLLLTIAESVRVPATTPDNTGGSGLGGSGAGAGGSKNK